jgi:hypothetical protein
LVLQSLYGILQDDYDYEEVDANLEPSLQQFIRASCCHPATIQQDLIHNVMHHLTTSEKVGID